MFANPHGRRHFLAQSGFGLSSQALASLLQDEAKAAPTKPNLERPTFDLLPKQPHQEPQFFFQQPKSKKDQERIVRLSIVSSPAQTCGMYGVWPWKYVDQFLKDQFGVE